MTDQPARLGPIDYAHQQQAEWEAAGQAETFHAVPPDGSGLTPCCGRTPFELPRGDRISSETVTCRGAAAPTALRDQYAAAIASYDHAVGQATNPAPGDHHHGQADAVLAVRDRELEQLRAAVAEVRRLCELTIAASVRVQAVEQARDMLAALDRHTTA